MIWNDTVGSPVTITLYAVLNGTASLPNNGQLWFDIEYMGDAGSPLTSFAGCGLLTHAVNDVDIGRRRCFDLGWAGGTKALFVMSVTVTPQQKGYLTIYPKAGTSGQFTSIPSRCCHERRCRQPGSGFRHRDGRAFGVGWRRVSHRDSRYRRGTVDLAGDLSPSIVFAADVSDIFALAGDLAPSVSFAADLSVVSISYVDLAGNLAPVVTLLPTLSTCSA